MAHSPTLFNLIHGRICRHIWATFLPRIYKLPPVLGCLVVPVHFFRLPSGKCTRLNFIAPPEPYPISLSKNLFTECIVIVYNLTIPYRSKQTLDFTVTVLDSLTLGFFRNFRKLTANFVHA